MSASESINPFDENAEHYDAWFDSPRGHDIFEAELKCLRPLVTTVFHPWLEIGVGTGRFSQALEVGYGIDPSLQMLKIAAKRGINVQHGVGEKLPYKDVSFGGVMVVASLCFVADPECVIRETARVLRDDGQFVIGIIPANSFWGKMYSKMAEEGHPIYSKARFFTVNEVIDIAKSAGFKSCNAYSTLINGLDSDLSKQIAYNGIIEDAGFVAMSFCLK